MENSLKPDDTLARLQKQFIAAADASLEHRREAERARDYFDGAQWTAEEVRVLKKRRQPIITDNRIFDKVEYLKGMERRTRTDPKAYPRNPQDESSAEAATDAIRYVFDCNDFQQVRSLCFELMCVEGVTAAEVVRDGNKDKIRRIRWDRFYYDPHSVELDFSDASYFGVITWMDESRLLARYPDKRTEIEGVFSEATRTYTETFDDKPTKKTFVDLPRRRLQVFETYWWEGKWMRAVWVQGAYLEEPAPSPYVDEDGVPEHPYVVQAAYRDRNGDPYGVVRRYRDLQDEINKRRSKALHALSSRRTIAEKGAVANVDVARNEVQRPDGWLEITPGMTVNVDSSADIGMSQFQLLQDALSAMAVTGPNAALQGQSGSISGRAKQLDQEGGAIQIGALFDQIRHFQKRVARMTWNRIKQFWTEETWVRVTDDEQKLKFVGLNVPVTLGELEAEKIGKAGLPPEQAQQAVAQLAQNPMSRIPVGRKNDVAQMHVDIVIEESPDTVTLQQEQFGMLVELAKSGAVQLPPDVLIEASGLRNKQRLLEKLKGGGEMTPEQQAEAQKVKQMQEAMAVAEVRKKTADADKAEAEARKTTVETAVSLDRASEPADIIQE